MKNEKLIEEIRNKRATEKITIEQVTESTHLPAKFIHMIEKGEWEKFPSALHLKGSLKQYMEYLKMDTGIIDEILRSSNTKEPAGKEKTAGGIKNKKTDNIEAIDKKLLQLVIILLFIFLIILMLTTYIMPTT